MALQRMNKRYLGDGVYAQVSSEGWLVLTTENGVSITNTIYLEPDVIQAMERYLEEAKQ